MGNRNTNLRRWAVVALVAMMAMAAGQGAAATTITFDFNALTDGRGNAEVQTYMRGVLAGAGFGADAVDVSGAKASKAGKGQGVYGEGAADAFILSAGIGTIVVTFDSPVYGVGFDYELFPERNCSVRAAIDLTGIDLIVAGRRHRSVDEPRARCPGSALPSPGPVPGPPGRALGERKVDVVVEAPMDDRPMVRVAHATGVRS